MTDNDSPDLTIDRRTGLKIAAWSVPVIATSVSAPAFAASTDPRFLQGWVLNSVTDRDNRRFNLDVDASPPDMTIGPDGNPFGLYVVNAQPGDQFRNAYLRYSVWGSSHSEFTISGNSDHDGRWGNPINEGYTTQRDGNRYRTHRWNYNGTILASQADANGRVFLGNFHIDINFRQTIANQNNVTYYTERGVEIMRAGTTTWVNLPLIRRNGSLGGDGQVEGTMRQKGGAEVNLGTLVLAS